MLKRYVAFLIVYMSAGIVGQVIIDSPSGLAFNLSFRYLALPIGVLIVVLAWRGHERGRQRWLAMLLFYVMVMLGTPAYVLLANSVGVERREVELAGPIVEKYTRSYKMTTHYVRIVDEHTGQRLAFTVSPADYRGISLGDHFSRKFFMGRFGIPYRWTIQ